MFSSCFDSVGTPVNAVNVTSKEGKRIIQLLAAIRDIYVSKGKESEWLEFIRRFAAENKGKKKLMERVRKELGVVL